MSLPFEENERAISSPTIEITSENSTLTTCSPPRKRCRKRRLSSIEGSDEPEITEEERHRAILCELGLETSLGEEVDLLPRRLPDRAWRRAHPIPRIPRSDLRKQFPLLLVNVVNSGDKDHLSGFFLTFLTSSCRMVDFMWKKQAPESKVALKEIQGSSNIASFFSKLVDNSPDITFFLKAMSLKQFLHRGGTEILMRVEIKGTNIRDIMVDIQDENKVPRVVTARIYVALLMARGRLSELPISEAIRALSTPECWPLFNFDPVTIDLEFLLTFHMDNNLRVYKMECKSY
eukprot:gene9793-10832_t